MKKMLKSIVLVSLIMVFASAAIAAEKKERSKKPAKPVRKRAAATERAMPAKAMEQLLKRNPEIDKDKDGKISKEEFDAFRKTMMEKRSKELLKKNPEIDKDKYGKISNEEMMAFRKANPQRGDRRPERRDPWAVPTPEQAERILKRHPTADKNKDGKLDKAEMEALKKEFMNKPIDPERAKKMLKENPKMDANKDGKLTIGEAQQWRMAQAKAAQKTKNAKDSENKAKDRAMRVPNEKQLEKILKKNPKADTDKDGKLSAEEYKAFRKAQAAENKAKREKSKGDKSAQKTRNKKDK